MSTNVHHALRLISSEAAQTLGVMDTSGKKRVMDFLSRTRCALITPSVVR